MISRWFSQISLRFVTMGLPSPVILSTIIHTNSVRSLFLTHTSNSWKFIQKLRGNIFMHDHDHVQSFVNPALFESLNSLNLLILFTTITTKAAAAAAAIHAHLPPNERNSRASFLLQRCGMQRDEAKCIGFGAFKQIRVCIILRTFDGIARSSIV